MRTIIISLLFVLSGCRNGHNGADIVASDSITTSMVRPVDTQTDNYIEINCDSIFQEKGYKIALVEIGQAPIDEESRQFAFKFFRHMNGRDAGILIDTIESSAQEIQFADYDGNGSKDILIQNYSDVRSNRTYYLFLFDGRSGNLKKIRGFEEIKNPKYLTDRDIVTNYVSSGTNWTSFYKIQADSVIDLDILIEDDLSDDGSYQRKFERAIADIELRLKNNR